MILSQQSTIFFIVMILYIFFTSPTFLTQEFIFKLLTISIITFCIQYLDTINLSSISWVFVIISIIYIFSILILQYLISI